MRKETPDMWELASALYLHGPNVDTLHTVLPNWTKADIQQTLRKFKNRAVRERAFIEDGRKSEAPQAKKMKTDLKDELKFSGSSQNKLHSIIDVKNSSQAALVSWSKLLEKVQALQGNTDKNIYGNRTSKFAPIKDHSQLLSKVMLYSACFEDHYHGGHPEDTCYSEIYRYLSQLLSGEEPTQLRPRSAAKVLQLLQQLTDMLNTGTFAGHLQLLQRTQLDQVQALQVGGSSGTGAAAGASSLAKEKQSIGLFEDNDPSSHAGGSGGEQQSIGQACELLDPLHPYYDEERTEVNSRLLEMQEATAASLQGVRGLNPLQLPPSLLSKPLKAFPHTYPARADRLPGEAAPSTKIKFSFKRLRDGASDK